MENGIAKSDARNFCHGKSGKGEGSVAAFSGGLLSGLLTRKHKNDYLAASEGAGDALCKLSENGVRVITLTNSLASNDVSAVHAGY